MIKRHFRIEPSRATVSTSSGDVIGLATEWRQGKKRISFYNIPYARVPSRFGLPMPPLAWTLPLICTKADQAITCMHTVGLLRQIKGFEDCLYLAVHTPSADPVAKLPVVVWFPDPASDPKHAPDGFINEGVVFVTVSFRCGVLGFLNLGIQDAPGNQGLHDQACALAWVKENISQFGGDVNNVSIMGQGPWAQGCFLHLVSPLSGYLFHQILAFSGSASTPLFTRPHQSRHATTTLALRLGINPELAPELMCKRLQTVFCKDLVLASSKCRNCFQYWGLWGPVVDRPTPFLPMTFHNAVEGGYYNKNVRILCGISSADGLAVVQNFHKDKKAWQSLFKDKILSKLVYNNMAATQDDEVFNCFQSKEYNWHNRAILESICRHSFFEGPLFSDVKLLAADRVLIYKYKFSHEGEESNADSMSLSLWKVAVNVLTRTFCFGLRLFKPSAQGGASYGDILTYIFSPHQEIRNLEDLQVHQAVQRYWINFIKNGNPNQTGISHWSRFTRNEIIDISIYPTIRLENVPSSPEMVDPEV